MLPSKGKVGSGCIKFRRQVSPPGFSHNQQTVDYSIVPGRKPARKRGRQRRRYLFLRPDPQVGAPQPLPVYRRPFVRLWFVQRQRMAGQRFILLWRLFGDDIAL